RTIGEFAGSFTVGGAEFVEKMAGKDGDIFLAITQRRNEKGNNVQAIEKILAETAVRDFVFQFLVGRGDDANIHANSLVRTDGFEALFFENAEHFGLRAEAHVADFVEEQRTAVGLLELADLIVDGPGEAAFD